MRLTTFILMIALAQVSAKGLAQKITLNTNHTPIEQVLQSIRNQSGYGVFYDAKDLKDQKITIKLNNVSVEEAISELTKDLPLSYKIVKTNIVLTRREPSLADATLNLVQGLFRGNIDVRGVVRNEKGEALEGISITIKGTNKGTTTNAKGEFLLKGVDENATLVFSGVSIETYEVKVNGKKEFNVNLRTRQVQLEEVNVEYSTGYQKIPKERATGSFVFVDSVTINRRVDANILDRLRNLVPGLLFDKRAAGPARLQLRGVYSFTESRAAPLIVVDNFPYEGNINNINPNDIENISILRDAAAASIWGAKAGNGVIVITTKQSKFNQKAQISINSSVAHTGKPDLFKLPIVSSAEIVDLEQFLYEQGNYYSVDDPRSPVSKVAIILEQLKNGQIGKAESDRQLGVLRNTDIRNDLLKYSYRSSIRQSHALNVSGGSNVIKYFISAGYNKDLIELKRNDNTRFTFSSSNTIQPHKNLEIQTNVVFSSSLGINNNDLTYGSLGFPNYYNLADDQGNALPVPRYFKTSFTDTVGKGKLLDWSYRPLDELNNNDRTSKSQTFTGRVNFNYSLLKGLKLNIDYQYSRSATTSSIYNSTESFFTRDLINRFSNFGAGVAESQRHPVPLGGILDLSTTEFSSHNLRSGFSFNQNWNDKHQVSLTGGAEMSEKKTGSIASRNYGYTDELSTTTLVDYVNLYPTYYGSFDIIPDIGGNKVNAQNNRFAAIYASGSYTYNNRYTISGSIRKDAANVLGVNTNQRGRPFWSAGLLWKVDKENFYGLGFLPLLNVRMSLGNGGNTSLNNSALTTISYNSAASNPIVNLPFAGVRLIGNPNLRWEKVHTLNLGIDFGLKNGLVSGSIEYYVKRSADVLASRTLDLTTGINSITANSASMKGNGIDINLNTKIVRTSAFNWNLNCSFSTAKFVVNEYLFERNLTNVISNGFFYPIKGYNPYLLTSYKWLGLDAADGDPQGYFDGKLSKDWNSITNSTPWDDIVKHGSAVPVAFGNLINALTYKGFTFSTNLVYKFNYYFRRPQFNYFNTQAQSGIASLSNEYNKRWKVSGDERYTDVPSFSYPFSTTRDIFYDRSAARIEKADHIRIDDFSLSYSLNKFALKNVPFKSMSLTANVSNLNLVLWKATKTNLDAENPNGNIAGKTIFLAVNLTF